MRKEKITWYESVTLMFYNKYERIRLTDSQLAKLIVQDFGGEEMKHLSNIRRSRCNDKNQPYVIKAVQYTSI